MNLIKKIFIPVLDIFRIRKLSVKKFSPPKFSLKIPSLFQNLTYFPKKVKGLIKHKNTILITTFIILLLIGGFISQREKQSQFKKIEASLNKIEEKVTSAEGFLVLKETNPEAVKKANVLLKEAWDELLPITEVESPFKDKALSFKTSIEAHLFTSNKLEVVSEPEVFFDFEPEKFVPQRIIYLKGNLYFFSPFSNNLFKVDKDGKGNVLETSQSFNLAANYDDSFLFFLKPNKITLFQEDNFKETFDLKEPYSEFSFNDFSSYKGNVYFLDSKRGEIVQYPAPLETGVNKPKLWLNQNTKKVTDALSFAMDGKIWVLQKENIINQYLAGKYQKTLNLNFFPPPKSIFQIFTSLTLPYLYLLEPVQSRIIIIDKAGNVIKQFQSEKFDNLNDFAISPNGKTIWLLNGLKVYQVKF